MSASRFSIQYVYAMNIYVDDDDVDDDDDDGDTHNTEWYCTQRSSNDICTICQTLYEYVYACMYAHCECISMRML